MIALAELWVRKLGVYLLWLVAVALVLLFTVPPTQFDLGGGERGTVVESDR